MKVIALSGLVGLTTIFAQLDWQGLALVVGAIGTAAVVIIRAIGEVKKELVIVQQGFVAVKEEFGGVKKDVVKLVEQTNGMNKDLIGAKEDAATARGILQGMVEQKAVGKEDEKLVREQIKEAAGTLSSVKATGEDTNAIVKKLPNGDLEAKIDASPDTQKVKKDDKGEWRNG